MSVLQQSRVLILDIRSNARKNVSGFGNCFNLYTDNGVEDTAVCFKPSSVRYYIIIKNYNRQKFSKSVLSNI